MSDSLGRIVMLVAVAAGIWWAATTFFVHEGNGGVEKAAAAVRQAAQSRHMLTTDVKCSPENGVDPSSIDYVKNVVLSRYSHVQLFYCTSPQAAGGGGVQPWCVVGASGAGTDFAMNEDCSAWAGLAPAP